MEMYGTFVIVYKSKRKCNLKKHIDSVHGGVRHSCDQCDYKTKRKVAIKRHIDSVHGGVRYSVNHNTTVKANLSRDLKCTKEKKNTKNCKIYGRTLATRPEF